MSLKTVNRYEISAKVFRLEKTLRSQGCQEFFTSGTSDDPVRILRSRTELLEENSYLGNRIDQLLGSNDWRGGDFFHLTCNSTASEWNRRSHWGPGRIVKWSVHKSFLEGGSEGASLIRSKTNGAVVATTVSIAHVMASRLENLPASYQRPRALLISGEKLLATQRSWLERVFGCQTLEFYACAELGIIAVEDDSQHGYIVENRRFRTECLDGAGLEVPNGEIGELTFTPKGPTALELYRYRTGDLGRIVERANLSTNVEITSGRLPLLDQGSTNCIAASILIQKTIARAGLGGIETKISADEIRIDLQGQDPEKKRMCLWLLALSLNRQDLFPSVFIDGIPLETKISNYLKSYLSDLDDLTDLTELGIRSVFLAGSASSPLWRGSFSDVDLVFILCEDEITSDQIDLIRYVANDLPRVSVSIETMKSVSTISSLDRLFLGPSCEIVWGEEMTLPKFEPDKYLSALALGWARQMEQTVVNKWPLLLSENGNARLAPHTALKVMRIIRKLESAICFGERAESEVGSKKSRTKIGETSIDMSFYDLCLKDTSAEYPPPAVDQVYLQKLIVRILGIIAVFRTRIG